MARCPECCAEGNAQTPCGTLQQEAPLGTAALPTLQMLPQPPQSMSLLPPRIAYVPVLTSAAQAQSKLSRKTIYILRLAGGSSACGLEVHSRDTVTTAEPELAAC